MLMCQHLIMRYGSAGDDRSDWAEARHSRGGIVGSHFSVVVSSDVEFVFFYLMRSSSTKPLDEKVGRPSDALNPGRLLSALCQTVPTDFFFFRAWVKRLLTEITKKSINPRSRSWNV